MGTWEERPKSRKLKEGPKSASRTDMWVGRGYSDSTVALNALKASAPVFALVGLKLVGGPEYTVDPVVNTDDDTSASVYNGSVTYKTAEQQQQDGEPEEPTDETLFTFDFSSMEGVRINAITQTTYNPDVAPLVDWTKAINQQHPDLPPEGVKVNKPIANFVGKSVVSSEKATHQFWKDQLDQVWTLNEAEFLKFPAKCVALTGISGELRSSGFWHLEYSFEYRPMQEAEVIKAGSGKSIPIPELPGWVYIWAEYTKIETDRDNNPDTPDEVRRVVNRVHVAEIYKTSDFEDLEINGG